MPYYTYDTSTIVARNITNLPDSFLLSAVVLLELMASAKDATQRKVYEALYRDYRADNTLIVPIAEDWLLASKALYWMGLERRRSSGGRLPRLRPGASQRMALDALLAAGARRWKASVVTENWDDFKAIQRYCNVKIIKGSEFFK
jgi:predicted nucleic acid-binding protein